MCFILPRLIPAYFPDLRVYIKAIPEALEYMKDQALIAIEKPQPEYIPVDKEQKSSQEQRGTLIDVAFQPAFAFILSSHNIG